MNPSSTFGPEQALSEPVGRHSRRLANAAPPARRAALRKLRYTVGIAINGGGAFVLLTGFARWLNAL